MIIEYCATRLIPKIKIDFCPNKRRLILLSCPLQLISIDSRSPNGQRQAKRHRGLPDASFQFTQPKWAATRYSFIVASVASSFNSRSPSGLRLDEGKFIKFDQLFQFTQPKRAATPQCTRATIGHYMFQFTQPKRAAIFTKLQNGDQDVFLFTQPKQAATWACQKSR